MKELLLNYVREFNWRLLPIWMSLACLTAWLAVVTTFSLHEAGATQQQIQELATIFEWLPLFFIAMPFFNAAVGVGVSRVVPSGWSL